MALCYLKGKEWTAYLYFHGNMTQVEKKSKVHVYWSWLESLRGIAALAVFIFHGWLFLSKSFNFSIPILDVLFIVIFDLGKIAVGIFFLISGYLLPYSMRNKTKTEFIENRFFRLYPTYWISIALAIILVGGFSLKQIAGNITMFQIFLGIKDMVGAYWTLPIELLLYIGCLFFYKFLYSNSKIFKGYYLLLGFTLVASILRYVTEAKVPVAILLLLSISILGYIIRLYKEEKLEKNNQLHYSITAFILFLLPITILAYNRDMGYGETWYRYTNTYIMSIVVFMLFLSNNIYNRLLGYLGKISYSLYLTHGVVIMFYSKHIDFFLQINRTNMLLSFFISTFIIAILTYYLIEKPSFSIYMKYKRRNK